VAAESWSFWFGFGRKEYGNLRNGATPANHVLSPDSLNALQRPTAYSAGSVALKAGVDVSAQEQLTSAPSSFIRTLPRVTINIATAMIICGFMNLRTTNFLSSAQQ
jgi:hypothetical protein